MLTGKGCPSNMLSISDALEAVEGRWKLLILFSLSQGSKRFNQLSKEVSGITDKTLSEELKIWKPTNFLPVLFMIVFLKL